MRLERHERKGDGNEGCRINVGNIGGGVAEMVGDRPHENRNHSEVDEGAGDDRVRNPRRSARRDRDIGHHGVQAEAAGIMERHCGRHKRLVAIGQDEAGQSTVEFAVVMAAFLAVMTALAVMWRAFEGGLLVEHALAVASHHIQSVVPVTLVDIFLY